MFFQAADKWSLGHKMAIKEQKKAQREIFAILYINMANFPKAVEGCWGRGLLDDVKWKN